MQDRAKGFWSYVHADDDAEQGRILRLAHDICAQYEMITAEEINLFVDRDDVAWGADWRNAIETSLATTAYFIPVITPRYFESIECRNELRSFVAKAELLGLQELVMPILYVDVPALNSDNPEDEIVKLIQKYNWEPWTDIRFCATDSPEYRRSVAKLAQQLADRNKKLDEGDYISPDIKPSSSVTVVDNTSDDQVDEADDALGAIDAISIMETTIPEWTQTINQITTEIDSVNSIISQGSKKIETATKRGQTVSQQVGIFKLIAKELSDPADNIFRLGNEFITQVYKIDTGMKEYFKLISILNTSKENPDNQTFIDNLASLDASMETGLNSAQEMLNSFSVVESMSRDLRKPLKQIRKGINLMLETRGIVKDWLNLAQSRLG